MGCLNDSATAYLSRLEAGLLPVSYSASEYLQGNYTYEAPLQKPGAAHHAGPGVALGDQSRPMSLGERMLRPPRGVPYQETRPVMETRQGTDKRSWLSWDGRQAVISGLDSYVLHHRRRMKGCTAFDTLTMNSGENQVFGTAKCDYMHFNPAIGKAVEALRDAFPEEAAAYAGAFDVSGDADLNMRVRLINPMAYIGNNTNGKPARYTASGSERATRIHHFQFP